MIRISESSLTFLFHKRMESIQAEAKRLRKDVGNH